ncbi:uncharacterized protein UTRI_10210 [Ustilago trichophora]|uniref:Uncharacterized protein n=1 Tax=Ustilago trichophora TaxID=86804 RepID=A0A5C3EGL0_9BASI|nr:uncharacterized protein UTRI_10210 [Ustilago trichophora]
MKLLSTVVFALSACAMFMCAKAAPTLGEQVVHQEHVRAHKRATGISGPIPQGVPTPSWWPRYVAYRNQALLPVFHGNVFDASNLQSFKDRIVAMWNVRREALVGSDLTYAQKLNLPIEFHAWNGLKANEVNPGNLIAWALKYQEDVAKLNSLYSVLDHFTPHALA